MSVSAFFLSSLIPVHPQTRASFVVESAQRWGIYFSPDCFIPADEYKEKEKKFLNDFTFTGMRF